MAAAIVAALLATVSWVVWNAYNPPYVLDLHNPIVGMGSQRQP